MTIRVCPVQRGGAAEPRVSQIQRRKCLRCRASVEATIVTLDHFGAGDANLHG